MSLLHYIVIFVSFSVVGWILDTSYRSLTRWKYSPGTKYYFDPVYGIGATVLALFFSYSNFSLVLQIIFAGLLLTLVEFLYGIGALKILGYRIWDYRENKFNVMGHVDLLHSFYWIILAALYYLMGLKLPLYAV